MDRRSNSPQKIWNGSALVDILSVDNETRILAFAMQALGGMAAESVVFEGSFTCARDDLHTLRNFLQEHGGATIDPQDPGAKRKLFGTSPYDKALRYATQLIDQKRFKLEAVSSWREKNGHSSGV